MPEGGESMARGIVIMVVAWNRQNSPAYNTRLGHFNLNPTRVFSQLR